MKYIMLVVLLLGYTPAAYPLGGLEAIHKYNERGRSMIDMEIIKEIESGGNPKAFNKGSGARGLYQITNICRVEYLNYHKGERIAPEDLFDPVINERIAKWYMNKRIPAMLRHYGKSVTLENVLISYNAGISYAVLERVLPKETKSYILKYKAISHRGLGLEN